MLKMDKNYRTKIIKKISGIIIIGSMLVSSLFIYGCGCSFLDDEEYSETDGNASQNQVSGSVNNSGKTDNTENRNETLGEYFDTTVIRERGVTLKGDGTDKVTVLVYMNGSNLESESGEASEDLSEMVKAGTSENVNILVQTMGTKKWSSKYKISGKRSQRYKVVSGGLELVDDSLKQLDCTEPSTLADFIKWGKDNYPADRYILLFWNHGAGPVYGFGYDEWQDEDAALTIDEMRTALAEGGVYFDFIGMDCCIMSCMEVCVALYDFCDYTILSEEFESGLGWSYTGWLKELNKNSSIDTVSLGRIIIDDNVEANETEEDGDSACLALIDESCMKILNSAWIDFAYANEDALLGENYSQKINRSRRAHPKLGGKKLWGFGNFGFFSNFDEDAQLSDYYITDIMAVAQNISSKEADALSSALAGCVVYSRATSDNENMTGLSVTLPYGDREFYGALKSTFTNCGFDENYITWLGKFVTAEGSGEFYDYDTLWEGDWEGWDEFEDDYDWEDWEYYEDEDYWDEDDCWDCFDEYNWEDDEYYEDDYYEDEDDDDDWGFFDLFF